MYLDKLATSRPSPPLCRCVSLVPYLPFVSLFQEDRSGDRDTIDGPRRRCGRLLPVHAVLLLETNGKNYLRPGVFF